MSDYSKQLARVAGRVARGSSVQPGTVRGNAGLTNTGSSAAAAGGSIRLVDGGLVRFVIGHSAIGGTDILG
jgi:hypothetical protein